MNLASRIFLFAYAAAMATVAVPLWAHRDHDAFGFETGILSLVYLLLALGYATARDRDRAPSRVWIVMIFVALLILLVPVVLAMAPEWALVSFAVWGAVLFTLAVLVYLGITLLLLRDFRSPRAKYQLRRIAVPLVLISGASLVFLSLFLRITGEQGTGWQVVMRKTDWVTAHVNVGAPILFGSDVDWLQPFYAYGGSPTYLVALLATLAILIGLAANRFSINRSRESSLVTLPALILSLASLWIFNDIFWGWHFDLSGTPWAAALATVLWFVGPLAGAILLVPLLWKQSETWRLRAFLLFQLPIAVFNLLPLQFYFGSDSAELPGIGVLIIGLLLESSACLDLLALRANRDVELVTPALEEALRKPPVTDVSFGKAS